MCLSSNFITIDINPSSYSSRMYTYSTETNSDYVPKALNLSLKNLVRGGDEGVAETGKSLLDSQVSI